MERIRYPQKLGDHLGDPDTADTSFVVLFEGWIDDLLRLHAALEEHVSGTWELVVVDNPVDYEASAAIARLERVLHIPLRDPVGWAAARNLGLRLAGGRIAIVVDTCVEPTGDVLPPLERALEDPAVGLVGKWGVAARESEFHFEETEGPDVDGVEAYFMAVRRADLRRTGLFDPKFKWYRNADLDFSFRVRAAGFRTIVDPTLPLKRHEHRLWEGTPPERREELSRRNFFRFLHHWRDRRDLFQDLA